MYNDNPRGGGQPFALCCGERTADISDRWRPAEVLHACGERPSRYSATEEHKSPAAHELRHQHPGITRSGVESYFHQRWIKEIADYCESDVVNTYRVWLRHELYFEVDCRIRRSMQA